MFGLFGSDHSVRLKDLVRTVPLFTWSETKTTQPAPLSPLKKAFLEIIELAKDCPSIERTFTLGKVTIDVQSNSVIKINLEDEALSDAVKQRHMRYTYAEDAGDVYCSLTGYESLLIELKPYIVDHLVKVREEIIKQKRADINVFLNAAGVKK